MKYSLKKYIHCKTHVHINELRLIAFYKIKYKTQYIRNHPDVVNRQASTQWVKKAFQKSNSDLKVWYNGAIMYEKLELA